MTTIEDIRAEAQELSPGIIRSRLQLTAEIIDFAQQKIKQLHPKIYNSPENYDNEVAGLNSQIAEFREQRELYHELLRANGHYEK